MNKAIDIAIPFVKRYEGFSASVYYCPAGKATIGYGHCITPDESEDYTNKTSISEWQATQILISDLQKADACITANISPFILNDNQRAALLSFVFNVGCANFAASTLLKYIKNNMLDKAANEFDRWVHAGSKVLQGLVNRRAAEKALFLTPITQVGVINEQSN